MTSLVSHSDLSAPTIGQSHSRLSSANNPRPKGHQYSASSSGLITSKSRRSLAALAKDKVVGLANIGSTPTPTLRSTTSSGSLQKPARSAVQHRPNLPRNITAPPAIAQGDGQTLPQSSTSKHSAPMNESDSSDEDTMHQTSSKILPLTEDGRYLTRDMKDLFGSLMVSLPLGTHRVRFTKIPDTFPCEAAITNLMSLQFRQSNKVQDPKCPSKHTTTTTTMTFTMPRDMARQICQKFVDARFIEPADGKTYPTFPTSGNVIYQLTPKGISILKRFADRNGCDQPTIRPLMRKAQMQIVVLERDSVTDRVMQDKTTIEVVFRRMCGAEGPNLKASTAQSDNDSLSEYATGLVGVKMAKDRRVLNKPVPYSFTGKAASDWLLDCCTFLERRETLDVGAMFVKWELMVPVVEDKGFVRHHPSAALFQPTKYAIYAVTEKGQRVCGWIARPPSMSSEESSESKEKQRLPKDTNMNRFHMIMNDPALRMLFREYSRHSLCEENFNFYCDVQQFSKTYRTEKAAGSLEKPDMVRECMATAYGLYNSFLAAGAPSELNIDHSLRHRLDARMTHTETEKEAIKLSLATMIELFELASESVAKLMASDSVPKFLRDQRYSNIVREHQIHMNLAQRSLSPAPSPGPATAEKTLSRSNTLRAQQT